MCKAIVYSPVHCQGDESKIFKW